MRRLIRAMVMNRLFISLILVFILLAGVLSLLGMKHEAFPAVSLNIVTIKTVYPGGSPEDVELHVTLPIERELAAIPSVDYYSSVSVENLSIITVQIDDDLGQAGMQQALADIRGAVDRVDNLPAQVENRPRISEVKIDRIPVLEVALSGPHAALRILAKRLEKDIKFLPGVALVTKVGYFDSEIHVEVDPRLLRKQYLSFEEIITRLRARNIRSSGGSFLSYQNRKAIVALSKFKNLDEVRRAIIRSNYEGRRVLLRNVASVRYAEKDDKLIARSNGHRGISLVVIKKPNSDILKTIDGVRAFMARQKLPKDIAYSLVNDFSRLVRNRISILEMNAVIGFVLVVVVLMLFLNMWTAFWTAFSIPLSILGAFAVLPIFGMTLNSVTLGGFLVVIGMLVDDAIVVSEHVEACQEKGLKPTAAAIRGAVEMVRPVSAAVLTTIAAYLPLAFLGGKPGKFIWNIPVVVTLTLLFSLFDTFFILPGHLARGKRKARTKGWLMLYMEERFRKLLLVFLRYRYLVVACLIMLFLGTLFFAKNNMRIVMMPKSATEKFFIKYEAPPGASLRRTEKDVIAVEQQLLRLQKRTKEIISFTSRVGHVDTLDVERNRGHYENLAFTAVYLTSAGTRRRSASQIITEIRSNLQHIKQTKITFEEYRIALPMGRPIEVYVVGNKLHKSKQAADHVENFLRSVPGVYDIERNDRLGKEEYVIEPNYRKLAAFGLTTKSVMDLVRAAFDGLRVTSMQTFDEEIWCRIILAAPFRRRGVGLNLLSVRNNQGRLIPIRQLVRLRVKPSQQELFHFNGQRAIVIKGEVDNIRMTALRAASLIRNRLINGWKLPKGVRIVIRGESYEAQKILSNAVYVLLLSICAIFFIVVLVLRRLPETCFVVALIPFAFIGVIWALYLHGVDISFFSIVGVIGLSGVVVNDAIVMLDRLNRTIKKKHPTIEQVAKQAASRLRPICMTTMTTVLALLPTAYGIGGVDFVITPLALTVAYGLLFCSLVTLFLVPCFYMIQNDLSR